VCAFAVSGATLVERCLKCGVVDCQQRVRSPGGLLIHFPLFCLLSREEKAKKTKPTSSFRTVSISTQECLSTIVTSTVRAWKGVACGALAALLDALQRFFFLSIFTLLMTFLVPC
jgi:hypothetical protein